MNKKILVVEDSTSIGQLLSWILNDEGYDIELTTSGEACIEVAARQAFDLVIMDISLPKMNGKEAIRLLRQMQGFTDIPILACTAHTLKDEEIAILDSGADKVIHKPFDENYLIDVVGKALSEASI